MNNVRLPLDQLNKLKPSEYIRTILDYDADYVDKGIENELLLQLVNKYIKMSKELEEKIKEVELLSITDPLTKTYNRNGFNRAIKEELVRFKRYKESFTVLLLDIDFFKKVNDTYGHDIGDETLIQFASIIQSMLRKSDIFARWGGEEFVILVVESDIETGLQLAERIRSRIQKTFFNKIEHITVSIGVTVVEHEDTSATIVKRVDNALYEAKETGRNKVVEGIE